MCLLRDQISSTLSNTLFVVSNINDSRLELPGRNPAVEQDIRLTIRAILELRKEEEGRKEAHNGCTSPDISTLASEIPSSWVEKLRRQVDHGDLGNIVSRTTDTSAQSTKTD